MIADKVLPCSFEMKFSGELVKSFFAEDFGLENVFLYSEDFPSDIEATHQMNEVAIRALDHIGADSKYVFKSVEYNGLFYPCGTIDDSHEKAVAQADIDIMSEQYVDEGQIPILVANTFDEDGDNVQSRWTYTSFNFSVVGKIISDLDKYVWNLGVDQMTRHETIDRSSLKTKITVH